MDVSILGLMTTVKMLVENHNRHSREFMLTGSDYELGAKTATLTAITYLAADLNLVVEFGTEYTENEFGYTIINAKTRTENEV